jgi:exodeoxyribonuclease VII large subunit
MNAGDPKEAGAPGSRVETVSEFTRRIKVLLEGNLAPGWVKGEVSNLRVQSSGHVYFSLKDAGAQLSAVLFRGDAARQTLRLRDGIQIIVYGEISLYEPRGQYQLVVRAVIEDGVGRLQREFEALKKRLTEEGLFDLGRNQPLPSLPATVGFITSPTGAAVRDFIRIMERRRWRGRVVVLPCKVQGEGAAQEMASMLAYAQSLEKGNDGEPIPADRKAGSDSRAPFFDLLVIGRGGGSLEDLWAFNEEVLVRAVAGCSLPIISAVGHEIDFTLCDFAADARAETPSAAAELISSSFLAAIERAIRASREVARLAEQGLADASSALDPLRDRLRLLAPAAQVERGYLLLDDLGNRLSSALRHAVQEKRRQFQGLQSLFAQRTPDRRVEMESQRLLSFWKRLQSASPRSVLNRGFVIVRDERGKPVGKRADLSTGQPVDAEFSDGSAKMRVE